MSVRLPLDQIQSTVDTVSTHSGGPRFLSLSQVSQSLHCVLLSVTYRFSVKLSSQSPEQQPHPAQQQPLSPTRNLGTWILFGKPARQPCSARLHAFRPTSNRRRPPQEQGCFVEHRQVPKPLLHSSLFHLRTCLPSFRICSGCCTYCSSTCCIKWVSEPIVRSGPMEKMFVALQLCLARARSARPTKANAVSISRCHHSKACIPNISLLDAMCNVIAYASNN